MKKKTLAARNPRFNPISDRRLIIIAIKMDFFIYNENYWTLFARMLACGNFMVFLSL